MSRIRAALVCGAGAAALLSALVLLAVGRRATHEPCQSVIRAKRHWPSEPRAHAGGADLAEARGLVEPSAISSDGKPPVTALDALGRGELVRVYERCQQQAARDPEPVAALLCQGRAALQLGWPQRAAFLAQRALALRESAEAYLLLGDAFEALRDCRSARPAYLRALELRPGFPEAEQGLHRCTVDLPPARDLRVDRAQGRARAAAA
ncbi:MAG: hypothetical protein RMK29_15560 [Myxococcales bacterium]|nr:hypothetical protein [Myxococcota bacterium]MDW8283132.1 hypothetical protein [Myxococcales bacterium]